MAKAIDISDVLNDQAYKSLKVGHVLSFNKDGVITNLQITKMWRLRKRAWAKDVTFLSDKEVDSLRIVKK